MWPRIVQAFGALIILLTLTGWYLLSGFGCEMNTSGCKTVRLDWSWDTLSFVLPIIGVGVLLIVLGSRKTR